MNRQELKSQIPHGYVKVIAKKAGVSLNSVSLFLNGKSNSLKVELAALEVLSEVNAKREKALSTTK